MADLESERSYLVNERIDKEIADIIEPVSVELDMAEKLRSLSALELGRAFIHSPDESFDQATSTYLAYSLPLNREQTKHVVLFADGHIFVTEPVDLSKRLEYQSELRSSSYPFFCTHDNLERFKRAFMINGSLSSKMIINTENKGHVIEINRLLRQALELSVELKKEREDVHKESIDMVINTISVFLESQDAPPADDDDRGEWGIRSGF